MNRYLLSIIEVLAFGFAAFFIGKNINLFTDDDTLVNLNYIFWGLIALLSVLSNFSQYIYFGTVLVLGIIFLGIYIYKVVKVITFVENDYKPIFWMLFGIFFIPFAILFFTKRILMVAIKSEAPQGHRGIQGNKGNRGKEFYVETIGDKAYVTIINEIDKMFKSILKENDVDFDYQQIQIKNNYLKENIKRICNSKQFIDKIIRKQIQTMQFDICRYDQNDISNKRYCTDYNGNFTNPKVICNQNKDCYNFLSIEDFDNINKDLNIKNSNSPLYKLLIRIKYWIRLILENNCEDDRNLREKFNVEKYYNLSDLRMGFITNFQEYQENKIIGNDTKKDNDFMINKINYKRMNNLLGRKFLQDNFQNHNYWENNNIKNINRNPFNIIHKDPIWSWGIPIKTESICNKETSNSKGHCNIKEHAMA
jgi:hypothetical protein